MDPNYDPLFRIRPVVDILNQNFSTAYTPSQDIMIEDSFMSFKGRSEVKVRRKILHSHSDVAM